MSAQFPMPKSELIERSLRCFVLGLLGLIPVLGIPMAVVAALDYNQVKRHQGSQWNPASRYLLWGGICARLGIIILLLGLLALAAALLI